MKTFEQNYTAWLDGLLSKEEAAAFEKQHPEVLAEREEMRKLKRLLQANLVPADLTHAEFFTSKLMEQIVPPSRRWQTWLGVPRLAWGGVGSFAVALLLFVFLIPRGGLVSQHQEYEAEVLKTTTTDPKITATVDSEAGITLIKLDGVDKVPDDDDLNN